LKAARVHTYGPPENLVVDDVPEPSCGPRDVLLEVHAAAVNPVDYKIRHGFQKAVVRLKLPWILGLDVSGKVVEVGSEVTRFTVGDEVYSSPTHKRPGTYAEYVAIDADMVAKKPASISHQEAASIPLVGLTTWESLVVKGKLESGQKLLVEAGAGGVGSFAIQLGKALGAEVATTCSTRNIAFCKELGADTVVDYTTQDLVEALGTKSQDVSYDLMGADHWKTLEAVTRRGGRIVSINMGVPAATKRYGATLGVVVAALKAGWWHLSNRVFRGIKSSHALRPSDGLMLERISALIDEGKIKPIVGHVFPLDDIAKAHEQIQTGRTRGKIVIAVR